MSSSSAPPPPAASGWAALPRDVLWSLFTELGQREVLSGAGLACAPWRRLARDEPTLWRRIDLTLPEEDDEDAAEVDEEESDEEEGDHFVSLFADDYYEPRSYSRQKTPAAMVTDDDGDLSDDDESSMFDLFDDGEKTHYAGESDDDFDGDSMLALFGDAPVCCLEEDMPAEDDDDDDVAEDDGGGGDLRDDDESLHLFDDTDDDMEEKPAKQDDDDAAEEEEEDGGELSDEDDESMHGLFDNTDDDKEKASVTDDDDDADDSLLDDEPATDKEKVPTVDDDSDEDDDDDGELGEECLLDETPTCQENTPVEGWKAMAFAAIDRSGSQCEAFWGRADDEVLLYLADRASSMKSLHLTSNFDVSSEVFIELIKKFPLLEELELVLKYYSYTNYYSTKSAQPSTNSWVELFQSACKACSHLHHFKVHGAATDRDHRTKSFSIPVMRSLHSLELSGDSSFTIDVVTQIVDNCPNLKSLNISDVRYRDRWELTLLNNKCYRIKDLKLPAKFYEPDIIDYSDDDMS